MSNIIILSIPRTGSTFIWQILSEIIKARPELKVEKFFRTHSINFTDLLLIKEQKNTTVFMTYRNMKDTLFSYAMSVYKEKVNEFGIDNMVKNVAVGEQNWQHNMHTFFSALLIHKNNPHFHLIKYEDYFPNQTSKLFDFIVKAINKNMPLSISKSEKVKILSKYTLKKNKERAKKFSGFDKWDAETMIHGDHIISNGKTNSWQGFVQEQTWKEIDFFISFYNKKMGYNA